MYKFVLVAPVLVGQGRGVKFQNFIALSLVESELYAVVTVSAEVVGIQPIAQDMRMRVNVDVLVDAPIVRTPGRPQCVDTLIRGQQGCFLWQRCLVCSNLLTRWQKSCRVLVQTYVQTIATSIADGRVDTSAEMTTEHIRSSSNALATPARPCHPVFHDVFPQCAE